MTLDVYTNHGEMNIIKINYGKDNEQCVKIHKVENLPVEVSIISIAKGNEIITSYNLQYRQFD